MNKVLLIGNLTRDPEVSETSNGLTVCHFAIAVQRSFSNADGERVADFFNIVAWRNQAENCGKYLKKGSKVAVEGSLQTRSYEDKDGVKRQVTEIIANTVEFLTSKNSGDLNGEFEAPTTTRTVKAEKKPRLEAVEDDDLPF